MADEVSNGHAKRPKDHKQVVTPLNILLIDCGDLKLKDVFDENRFTVYFGQLEENYVSSFLISRIYSLRFAFSNKFMEILP